MTGPRAHAMESSRVALLVIDVQGRLAPRIIGADGIEQRCIALVQGAKALQIPVFLTEHCPEALGATLPTIRGLVAESAIFAKRHFSAMNEPALPEALKRSGRDQILVAGMEAHVCVMQTMLGLLQANYRCWLATDALGSCRQEDRQAAIDRLRDAGATPASAEMALFEWARHADHPAFRTILSLVKAY
ncbi:MAG: isochorismatase family protein [Proteobacteria bacterium]|nr:isochorismatase family protein [Pseudomonadota bacterium]